MKRPWQNWLVFGLWLAVILGAMGWISTELVRLDRADVEARHKALLEENVLLALWRRE